jgi:glycosyltransferase involved in cell wall biosynthesis
MPASARSPVQSSLDFSVAPATIEARAQALQRNFDQVSPRGRALATPWASRLIHLGAFGVLIAVLLGAFGAGGVWVWSVGLAYVGYDAALMLFTLWSSWPLRRAAASDHGAARAHTLGVIVAAHNEASVLPTTLTALLGQARPPEQIVIADDGSSDGTVALLQERYGLQAPPLGELSAPSHLYPSLHWLRLPHGGKARALNAAIVRMDVACVLTVDADTLLEPDALVAVDAAFHANPDLVAATGVLTPVCGPGLQGRLLQWFQRYEYVRNFMARYAWSRLDSLLLISGAFACFRRDAVEEVGGFDADCLVEDYELIHRLRRHAAQRGLPWSTTVIGAALGRTEAPSTVPAFVRQRRRWFGGFLQTQYWYRDMVGDALYGRIGTHLLPVKAMDALQPFFGLAGWMVLVIYGARGRLSVVGPVMLVIAAKTVLDLLFQVWVVHLYRRWTGQRRHGHLGQVWLLGVIEPFSFQLLRHVSAAWGWVLWLRGGMSWGRQQRVGLVADQTAPTKRPDSALPAR